MPPFTGEALTPPPWVLVTETVRNTKRPKHPKQTSETNLSVRNQQAGSLLSNAVFRPDARAMYALASQNDTMRDIYSISIKYPAVYHL